MHIEKVVSEIKPGMVNCSKRTENDKKKKN